MQTRIGSSALISRKIKTGTTVYSYALLGFLAYIVTLLFALKYNAHETRWVAVLFLIPPLASIIGVGIHVKRGTPSADGYFYTFSMLVSFFSTLFYCALWLLYCVSYHAQWLSIASLIGIAALLCLIGTMMCAFLQDMNEEDWPRLSALRNGASNEQLWALCFLFFVLFLVVSYLFGFAFAFHDKATLFSDNIPALHMSNIVSPDDVNSPDSTRSAEIKKANSDQSVQPTSEVKSTDERYHGDSNFYFYFDSRRARLQTIPNKQCGFDETHEDIQPPQRLAWVSRDTRQFNYCSLEAIKLRLKRETKDGNRVRVTLVGRSDDHPIAEANSNRAIDHFTDYKSNYELSEARGQNVRFEIVQALKQQDDNPKTWLNMEWLSLPSSNEVPIEADEDLQNILQQTDLDQTKRDTFIDQNKRVVVATIASIPGDISSLQMKGMWPKSLSLMDYMYFSIYTITTTGYGDIVPATGYGKLVVSLANICEVLFLVVFVNTLISLKVRRKHRRRKVVSKPMGPAVDT